MVVGLALAPASCGSGAPPLYTGGGDGFTAGADGGSAGGGSSSGDAGVLSTPGTTIPSCEGGTTAGVCGCLDLPLLTDPPNLYFVLDRSASMTDSDKWTTIRQVVSLIISSVGPRGKFGAAVFPAPNAGQCSTGVQVMALRTGDSPAGIYGPATQVFTASTDFSASGGTPTAASLNALAPTLTALPGHTFVILATDGGPNCDDNTTCDVSACIPNIEGTAGCTPGGANCCSQDPEACLDTGPTVAAVSALASAGIPTYVIGVPGSGPYAAVLDQMALAGGTARSTTPYYYAVDSADEKAFTAALGQIAAKVTATCVFPLSAAPPDPGLVNVYFDGNVVPADPTNGWTLSGSTVTLVGSSCDSVLAGNVLSIRIVAGCPTVIK